MTYNRFAGYQRNPPTPASPPAPATVVLTGDITGQAQVSAGESSLLAATVSESATGVNTIVSANGDLSVSSPTGSVTLTVNSAPKWDTARTLSFTGDATGSGSVDGSANVASALTLATVNSNVGTFGDAQHVARITLNGKGLATAAANVAIIPQAPSSVVASLPASPSDGLIYLATDCTLTAITGLGLAPTGGGTNKVLVYSASGGWVML